MHYMMFTLARHRAELAKCEWLSLCCTCPAEVRPPLCASGQSALGLRAPRSRSPLYHLPTPPGSPAVWWTPVSLMETAWRKSSLKSIILCSTAGLLQRIWYFSNRHRGWSAPGRRLRHNGRKRVGRVDVKAETLMDKASENFWKCVIQLPRPQIKRSTSRDV